MKFNAPSLLKVFLLCIVFIFQCSCSKDSDLLSEYVLTDDLDATNLQRMVLDDSYQIALTGSMLLDVLANDAFENGATVVISDISTPSNGTLAINTNQTLTYTPSAEIIAQVADTTNTAPVEVVDTFTYTAEVVSDEGATTLEEASVVITTADNAARQEGVNLSIYGAIGDGVTDDTASIQNALDNETSIKSDPNKTYLISKTLDIDKNMAQVIDFNGSTLTRNVDIQWMLNIKKGSFGNSRTTLRNLNIDGNNQAGSIVDINSRVLFENIDIFDVISDNANGIRIIADNVVGMYGQSVFDNVNIHDLESVNNDGSSGNNAGMVHGFLVSTKTGVWSSETQIVYKNSAIYNTWGEDAGGITLNSPGHDVSNTLFSMWFENVDVRDAQRRTVKNFIGNTTWINSTFTSAANDNPKLVPPPTGLGPAGLFVLAASSSATGATNNVICGCVFQGNPSDPFDSWFTQVIIDGENGPAGVEIRNSTFTGDHGGRWSWNGLGFARELGDITIANTTIGKTNIIRSYGVSSQGTVLMDSNNVYFDGKSTVLNSSGKSFGLTYSERSISYSPCPTID